MKQSTDELSPTKETGADTTDETSLAEETETDTADTTDEVELTRDDMFHILQCRRRRLVLKYLQEYTGEGPAIMSDIAEHIAAFEHDTTVRALRSQQRQRVYIALYQSHLPKMDKAGIIDYNQNRGFVESTALTEDFTPYLFDEPSILLDDETESETETEAEGDAQAQLLDFEQDSVGPRQYTVAAGVSSAAVAALSVGGSPLVLPSAISIAVITTALFGLLAVVHSLT